MHCCSVEKLKSTFVIIRSLKTTFVIIQNIYNKNQNRYFCIFHSVLLKITYNNTERRYKICLKGTRYFGTFMIIIRKLQKITTLYSTKRVWQMDCWLKVCDKNVIAINEPTSLWYHLMPNISHSRRFTLVHHFLIPTVQYLLKSTYAIIHLP